MSIGARIREARKRLGFTQERLADQLGVSTSAVWQWESPKHRSQPELERLPLICDTLGMTLDELLRDDVAHIRPAVGAAEEPAIYNAIQLTSEEHRFLAQWRALPKRRRDAIKELVDMK